MPDTDIFINKKLFERLDRKKERLDAKRPLPEDALRKLREEMKLVHTYHSNAIEGNTLSLRETEIVIKEGITIGGRSLAEHLEATGNAQAFDRVEELAQSPSTIDHAAVLELHEMATRGLLADSGKYRTQNVRIVGAKKTPPDFLKIPAQMDSLFAELARMEEHRVIVASYLHHRFVEIHPFADGNGRVARLLTNLFLMKYRHPPVVLKKEDRKKYHSCLAKADLNNLGPLANFIGKAVDGSLTIYLATFGGKDELLPLRELAKASPYSQEYLSLRSRQGILDAVKIGRVWHSTPKILDEYIEKHRR